MREKRKIAFEEMVTTKIYDPTEPVNLELTRQLERSEEDTDCSRTAIISRRYTRICEAQGINESYIDVVAKTLTSTFHDLPSSRLYVLETILRIGDFPYFISKSSIDLRYIFDLKRKNQKRK